MTDAPATPDEAARRAREILERDVDRRVNVVVALTSAANESDAAEERAKEARATHERAWSAALTAGWSEKDLRATGARAPGSTARPKRRTRTSTAAQTEVRPTEEQHDSQ
ncbi:hypothetical protein [Clavibacter phaseoli]|uniref:hypothetical protein n=1 Tax=Clavibacter phaseoli TaxID=1734031 RepID=UPI001F3A8A7B|nr:hypothetical protein [Clavibacter phaseoli]UKF32447.1 hypothetical protein FGD69_15015 [Clavibacter phaseoli]UKF38532.1 hypothetical protein FGI33_15335 [Clavibacter phaseoli]